MGVPSQAAPPTSSREPPPSKHPARAPRPPARPRPRPGPPSSALQRRVCILPTPLLVRWAPLLRGREAARTREQTGLGAGTQGRGRDEAPPPGSPGRPVTPPAPAPRGRVAKLASPLTTAPPSPERHPATPALPPGQGPARAGPAPPPLGLTRPQGVPPGPPPETMAHPSPGRPRSISAITALLPSPGGECPGSPVSQKCRSRPGR